MWVDAKGRGPADGAVLWRRGGDGTMSTPLYRLKAEFFKTLGHPARIRVLELLSEREYAVAEMLPEIGIEPAHLSQQLAVLRRMNLVVTRKEGSTVYYSLTSPHVAELLRVARTILSGVLAGQAELLADLRDGQAEAEPRPGADP
jgi:ArsR family transcriptional regulator